MFDEEGNQIDASAGRRGVNVTVLDPITGEVLDEVGFDTAANLYESEALAACITGDPIQADRAGRQPGQGHGALDARSGGGAAGVDADVTSDSLAGKQFAIVGVRGAVPGSAAQSTDADEAFVSVSLNRDRRPLAAAVDWIEIENGE